VTSYWIRIKLLYQAIKYFNLFFFILFIFFNHVANAAEPKLNQCQSNSNFNVGAGVYDITGPAAEEGMMGYAMIDQQTAGILQRLWARAFVIESPCNGKRVVFVNLDQGMVFQGITQQVIKKLKQKYGNLYNDDNVLLTGTHTHSAPGGFSTYTLYNLTTFGFSRDNFNTIVDGVVAAIVRAHNNMVPAEIKLAEGDLQGISFNRSPQAYLQNPEAERVQYRADIDTTMTLVRFDSKNGKPIGMINWFPLHGVSMNNKNHLINGDNKGYAEYLFEKDFASDYGPNAFVAAFAQANAGDVSPNQYGHEGGSGLEGIKSIEKAGGPQYQKAKDLFTNASQAVTGGVDYRHSFVAMDDVAVDPAYTNGQPQRTCPAAIGVSMIAGTQDGEGFGKQGVTCDTVSKTLPNAVCKIMTTPCQGAKPIALQTGKMRPYPWTPNILPLQVIKIGNLVIVAVPIEVTTMSGRRIKSTVAEHLLKSENNHVVISALANAYAGYVATNDEYQMQRYEAASTHFGPWELSALRQEYAKLTQAITDNKPVEQGPLPLDLSDIQINLQTGVVSDDVPLLKHFGDVYQNVQAKYKPGDMVQVVFWGGHPKNNYHTQGTFLEIQRFLNGQWTTILRDRDWGTEYHWQRHGAAYSLVTIVWRMPSDMPAGQYRIAHYGDWKSGWSGKITPYAGYSSVFTVG
jgi:neutral ceramidase